MREDYLEAMEKMFPEGFILVRMMDKNRVQLAAVNKKSNSSLHLLILLFSEIIKELNKGEQ